MERLFAEIPRTVDRTSVVSPYTRAGARQIAQGGHIAYGEVNLADRDSNALTDAGDQIKALADRIHVPGLHVALGGDIFQTGATNGTTEAIGLLAAMIILLIAFGSVLAMGLPIGTALFGVGTGIARHLDRADGHRHAQLHDRSRGDGRHRRRDRLRAVHGDAVPGEPAVGARAGGRGGTRGRHVGPGGALRRHDGAHLGARSALHRAVRHPRRRDRASPSACS